MASNRRAVGPDQNPWKWAALGMGGIAALAIVAGAITATHHQFGNPPAASAPAAKRAAAPAPASRSVAGDAPLARAVARPSTADIDDCNRVASASHGSRTRDVLTDAVIGGAAGAALGAAGGAIADGGSGAGKGAGIGGLVGVTAGTLYGLNKTNAGSADSAQAYRLCMERKGY
jgi:hypothetical protein